MSLTNNIEENGWVSPEAVASGSENGGGDIDGAPVETSSHEGGG